ncbi:MAG: hypothetical protein AB7O73_15050 [Bacteroidia bacterium]
MKLLHLKSMDMMKLRKVYFSQKLIGWENWLKVTLNLMCGGIRSNGR